RVALPYRAKPAAARTAARGENVSRLDVAAGDEFSAWIAIGDAAELDGGDGLPLLGQVLGPRLVVGERHADVHLVGLGVPVGRSEAGERVGRGRFGLAGENSDEAHGSSVARSATLSVRESLGCPLGSPMRKRVSGLPRCGAEQLG